MPPPTGDFTSPDVQYNSMQQQAGLLPAVAIPPPVVFPGQISAMLATGGPGAAMGALPQMFPGSMYQTMTGAPPMYQGPTGVMQPQMPAAPYNPYPGPNPYAGLGNPGPPSIFAPPYAAPPPMYAGPQGGHVVPFGPAAPPAMFDTPYGAHLAQTQAADDRAFTMHAAGAGFGARVGTNALAGMAGAAIGSRFGGWGAAIGGALGFFGSEFGGLGQAGQNSFMNNVMGPSIQQRALAGGVEHASAQFVPFGSSLHASGAGFSHHASMEAAQGLMTLGNSASFRRETFDRFNTQDLFKITQAGAHAGLMSGVGNPEDMVSRVRDIAKSVNAFMELAKEPDIQRAIHTMGSMRASGLNLSETLGAVQSGRAFARMVGMTFQEMAEVGGGMGSSTFQSMGLSQGLGFRTGMANFGIASASQNAGILSPQMMSMVGGAQGLANLNNMFSAGLLQLPMLAPGMMTANGGLNQGALEGLMSGRADLFSMTGRGSNMLTGMAGRHGVEGLGMAVAMQPMLQDQIGRIMAAQGPFAQRNIEDTQITNLARQMNMRGSAGFMTAAQAMGMSQSQALARAQELSSPGYFEGQRQRINLMRREGRAAELRQREAEAPSISDTFARETGLSEGLYGVRSAYQGARQSVLHFIGIDHAIDAAPLTDSGRRRARRRRESAQFDAFMESVGQDATRRNMQTDGVMNTLRDSYDLAEMRGGSSLVNMFAAPIIAGTTSRAERRGELRDYAEGRRLSGLIASTTDQERQRLGASTSRLFGEGEAGIRAQQEFGQALAGLMGGAGRTPTGSLGMSVNAGFRVGTAFVTRGLIDPGNILGSGATSGSQIRNAYVNALRRTGMSQAAIEARLAEGGLSQAVQASSGAALDVMTPEQRQRMYQDLERTNTGGRGGGFNAALREREATATSRLLGANASAEDATRFLRQFENIEGIGREGTAKHEFSRRYMMARAQLVAVAGQGGDRGQRARRLLQELAVEASRNGISTTELAGLDNRARGMSSSMTDADKDNARRFVDSAGRGSAREMLTSLEQSTGTLQDARSARNVRFGALSMAQGGGAMADILRGLTGENFSEGEVRDRLLGASRDNINRLAESNPEMARAIRRYQQSGGTDTLAYSAIREQFMLRGERGEDERRRYREERGIMGSILDAMFSGREDEQVLARLRRTTRADTAADAQESQSVSTEDAARRAGVGASGDALLDASRELRQVSANLRDVLQGNSLDNLVRGS